MPFLLLAGVKEQAASLRGSLLPVLLLDSAQEQYGTRKP